MSTPAAVFISHASCDDAFVAELRGKLQWHGLQVWDDSQCLRGGDRLQPQIVRAIRAASHVIVVLSPDTVKSAWVRQEIRLAEARGWRFWAKQPARRIIPLLLPGMDARALPAWFKTEPLSISVGREPGQLQAAMPAILAALGLRQPDAAAPQIAAAQPLAELLLELTRPVLSQLDSGAIELSADAHLELALADSTQEAQKSPPFRFTAPIGAIELDEIRWYLEEYHRWPVGLFRQRAEAIETKLPQWGQALYAASLGQDCAQAVVDDWRRTAGEQRFSVRVEARLPAETPDPQQANALEAASRWLGLPWELLHDGQGYLSEGASPVRVRRRLPNYQRKPPLPSALPIRVLLLSPRPEESGYIDHRAAALPLVAALASLGDTVRLTLLRPPTFPALQAELQRARQAGQPYQVLHFDGHGVYDPRHGLGALCFEDPQDANQATQRRCQLIHADQLAALLHEQRIALVHLDACQSAQSQADPRASVAARLLENGVASVAAMSHSVLVESARRFTAAFYRELAQGARVGQAMLAGQTALQRDSYRLPILGAGELHLQDWFVPVLYQEQHDPVLFQQRPGAAAEKLIEREQQARLGALPETPAHCFIGRSYELLVLERLLEQQPYALLRGMGGAGKTTLAVELCRWLVASQRFERCAFVSLEQYSDARAVLDALGRQWLPQYSVAEYGDDLQKAVQPIARVLEQERCLILLDNLESLLPAGTAVGCPPDALDSRESSPRQGMPGSMARDGAQTQPATSLSLDSGIPCRNDGTAEALQSMLNLAQTLLRADANTRLLFTSREALPAPFDAGRCEIELGALRREDAIDLVSQVLRRAGQKPQRDDAGNTPQQITDLVEAVHCHARALVLLAQQLAQRGVTATTAELRQIMADLDARHPGQRESSLFASVELSLRRLSPQAQAWLPGLAVFHDGGVIRSVSQLLAIEMKQAQTLLAELVAVGLAEELDYTYHRFDPALPAYLDLQLDEAQRRIYRQRWREAIAGLVDFLYQQKFKDANLQARLTRLELANLLGFLQQQAQALAAGELAAAELADQAGSVEALLANLGQPRVLEQAVALRRQAARLLSEWSRARFEHERLDVERLLQQGALQAALAAAQRLLQQCQAAGETAYPGADYDSAVAYFLLGRLLSLGGAAQAALPLLAEAQQRFERLGDDGAHMAAAALTEQGDCLRALGQLQEAAALYQEAIRRDEQLDDLRSIAVGKIQLASVRLSQRDTAAALQGYQEALALFQRLGEPDSVATIWHQIGMVHRRRGDYPAAEPVYRQALALRTQQGNRIGEADSLGELGNLYAEWNCSEQAVAFYRQALEIFIQLGDLQREGLVRCNLANALMQLRRYGEARPELLRALECFKPFDHAALLWVTWGLLYELESAVGDAAAAQAARRQALQAFLAYRRDGGENHFSAGRLAEDVWQALRQRAAAEFEPVIAQLLQHPEWQENSDQAYLHALQAILAGARDPALAEDESLSYDMAAELAWLLERLASA